MQGRSHQRQLRLILKGGSLQEGKVPVAVLAAKLQALQNLLFHAAATVSKQRLARRGQWQNRYREFVELTFVTAHQSDLEVEVEMPEPSTLSPEFDTGLSAVDLVFQVGQAIQSGESAQPDLGKEDRTYLLRAFEGLFPNVMDDYQVELENCAPAQHPKLSFTAATRRSLRELLHAESQLVSAEEATLVGELIKIHIEAAPQIIAIRHKGIEIQCHYSDSLRDQVANLLAGSLVEVTGWATLDNEGRIVRIDSVLDVETINMEPIRLIRFEHAGVRYPLRKAIVVNVEYTDSLWIYHNEPLNLWGYGARREDALKDLHESFAYLWKEFAEEDEAVLDDKARSLKQVLLEFQADEAT